MQSIRQRRRATAAPVDTDRSPERAVAPERRKTWRFYVKWTARVLLPIAFLLSNAKLVIIPNSTNHQQDTQSANLSIQHTTALVVVTHSRANYLSRCLRSVLSHHPGSDVWPVIISQDQQDGEDHDDVAQVVNEAAETARDADVPFTSWQHDISYDVDVDQTVGFVDTIAYRRISRHYYWVLSRIFERGIEGRAAIERVVILEDDMEIASDFYEYFSALTPLLESDETLMCISAWNDNGIKSLAIDERQLHRTDFFPGLGWMLTRRIWEEVRVKWPKLFWDDWMRQSDQMRGRQCIRPEVSRVANFGKQGVSQSFQFEQHVSKVVLSQTFVNFSSLNLSYLYASRYRHMVYSRMSKAVQLKFSNYLTTRRQDADVIAFYPEDSMEAIGKRTGIMVDDRDGLRRTSYEGVIIITWNGHWAFIVARGWEAPEGYSLGGSVCC